MTQGKTISDSRLVAEGNNLRLSVGPAGNFWHPAHTASGDYEVKATFKEHKMAASHPHSYGVFIGGADLESDIETLAYCIVYGNGTFSVKTFHGPKVTELVDRVAHDALRKADANGEAPVGKWSGWGRCGARALSPHGVIPIPSRSGGEGSCRS